MRSIILFLFSALMIVTSGFKSGSSPVMSVPGYNATLQSSAQQDDSSIKTMSKKQGEKMVAFAKTLLGTPYLYASIDPSKGFDCSGFVYYVASHFDLKVPRSSVDYTNIGIPIEKGSSRAGDLILFTGTNISNRTVGHIGIVISDEDGHLQFIHSSSGKANGVTISGLEGYYETRFVKIIRLTV
jgi:cell wall-associated NlpC family hydrolase